MLCEIPAARVSQEGMLSSASQTRSSAQEDKEQNNKHTGSGEGRSTVKTASYPSSNKIIEMVLGAAQSPAASTQKSDAAERREQEATPGSRSPRSPASVFSGTLHCSDNSF